MKKYLGPWSQSYCKQTAKIKVAQMIGQTYTFLREENDSK